MFQNRLVLAFVALLCFCVGDANGQKKGQAAANTVTSKNSEIPLELFFRNPEKTSFKVSPDGSKIAYLATVSSTLNLFVAEGTTANGQAITTFKGESIKDFMWVNAEWLVYTKDNGGDENDVLYSCHYTGGKQFPLTPETGVVASVIKKSALEDHILFIETNERNQTDFDVYRVNVNDGTKDLVHTNLGGYSNWVFDDNDQLRAAVRTEGTQTHLMYTTSYEAYGWQNGATVPFTDTFVPFFMSKRGNLIYCISNVDRDKSIVILYDLDRKKVFDIIYENAEYDVDYLVQSKVNRELLYVGYTSDYQQQEYIHEPMKSTFATLKKRFGDDEVRIISMSDDEKKMIIKVSSDVNRGSYHFYNASNELLVKLADIAPWLQADQMCTMEPYTFTTSDGVKLHGYITYPKTGNKKNLPLVVNPHGGPWARDQRGFNPEVQFLASRGYAVFQVNFRGSTGYGKKLWQQGFKQWGQAMQRDITEGVRSLINAGIADPKRIAIYGASYGGYATLAGLTYTPDLYACGIDYVGVSNLLTFMETIPPYWEAYREMMYKMVGDPETDRAMLEAYSPALKANLIKSPVFIAQGANDPRVNIRESDQMVEALRNAGVKVDYMVKSDEGHGFDKEVNRFEFYMAMEKFLAANLAK
jgi:dipeptidyl aminopeptidase/acylaminoacyl peptidase